MTSSISAEFVSSSRRAVSEHPKWTVRAAGPGDAEALALIGRATFLETFAGILSGKAIIGHCATANSAEAYAVYLANGARAWLAEVEPGGAPIGFALLTAPELDAAQAGDIELKRIYLLSRFHGSGVGAALMDAAVAAAQGFERLLLGVYADNARAIAFYTRNGFTRIGARRFDVGGTSYDDIVLARPLAN